MIYLGCWNLFDKESAKNTTRYFLAGGQQSVKKKAILAAQKHPNHSAWKHQLSQGWHSQKTHSQECMHIGGKCCPMQPTL